MVRTLRAAAFASALLLIVVEFLGMRDFARSPYTGIQHNNLVIRAIEPESPNGDLDLRPGDRIIRVNGTAIRNVNHYAYLVASRRPPSTLDLTIVRDGSETDVSVRGTVQPSGRVTGKFSITVVALAFILIGLVVVLKRPDILGILFTANCYILSFLVSERPLTGSPVLQIVGELGYDFLFIFLPAFFLHFFLLFPGREIERGTRRALVARFLYAPVAFLSLLTLIAALRQYEAPGEAFLGGLVTAINTLTIFVWLGYILASLALFVRTYVLSGKVQRIRFRIAILGVAAGIVPLTLLMLLKQFQPSMAVPAPYIWPLFLSLMPISFAYAILRHRAYDIVVLSRTIFVYVLLIAFVLGAYFVSVNVLGEEIGKRFGVSRSVVTATVIVLLAIAVVPARGVFQRLADRLTPDRRAALTNEIVAFSRRIQFLLSLEEVSSFVAGRMADIVQAEHAYLFLRADTGDYVLRASAPQGMRTPLTSFPPGTALIGLMKQERIPLMLEYFDRLWLNSHLDRISRELVSLSQAYAAVPLIEQEELLGFALVGRKASGRPYTGADAELLELLGERSAVAFMNIRLCGDSIIKDRLEKELRLASEIQTRLLPAHPPSLLGAEIAAKIVTSREVGGDFYDFVEPEPGVVGIAVADVSGKGIPAALLMSTLQASFRAEAIKNRSPANIISALNASLYERSDIEKFATFFCALYDDASGIVRFSNAGSSPPFIVSADGRISRLHRGGVIIGVEAKSEYSEGVVKLRQNDLLVIFTDGCTDQEDADGEPFEEKRLVDFIRNNLTLSVDAMIEKLFATLVAFGQRNLKDDMTVVLLRRILP